ncbi:hypothetical protein X767_32960 [Mesorhizobium sp. LSJC264A00]|nr:hypothetical protein X767_32960 [Mesorhizobium sp. LSJC264A00]
MQGVDLVPVLRLLRQEPLDEPEQPGKSGLEFGIAGDLAADVAEHPAEIGAKALEFATHPAELPGMRIAARPHRRCLGQPHVALPEHDAVPLGLTHQDLDCLEVEPAVGRMGDRLRLHRRIDGDPLQRTGLRSPRLECDIDACLQHFLQPLGPDPLAPARHSAGIDRRLVLEELEAAEKLPIRIFHPTLHHFFVGQIVDVLEVMLTDHQPGRLGRPADRAIKPAKRFVKARPRHQCRQPDQRMARIDDGIEALAEQIILTGRRTDWQHCKNTGKRRDQRWFPAFSNTSNPMGIPATQRVHEFFRANYLRQSLPFSAVIAPAASIRIRANLMVTALRSVALIPFNSGGSSRMQSWRGGRDVKIRSNGFLMTVLLDDVAVV